MTKLDKLILVTAALLVAGSVIEACFTFGAFQ